MSTTTQSLRWIALPYTAEGGKPRLSAFLSIRLSHIDPAKTGLRLTDYDRLTDLGTRLAAASWAVTVVGQAQPLTAKPVGAIALEPGLWKSVLGESPVTPWRVTPQATVPMRTFAAGEVEKQVKTFYGSLATATGADRSAIFDHFVGALGTVLGVLAQVELPPPADAAPPRIIATPRIITAENRLDNNLNLNPNYTYPGRPIDPRTAALEAHGPAGVYGTDAPWRADPPATRRLGWAALADAFRFYHRPEAEPADENVVSPGPLGPPTFDFHRALAALGDQSVFMRRIGLVVDLEVHGTIPEGGGTLRVAPTFAPGQAPSGIAVPGPGTRYRKQGSVFLPADADDVRDGQLALEAGGYAVLQIDVDGAALKLVSTASTAQAIAVGKPAGLVGTDVARDESVPSLRSAGLSLVRDNRLSKVTADLTRNDALEQQSLDALSLDAAHVRRGLRIDVEHDGKWRSLHARTTTLSVAGAAGHADDDGSALEHHGGEGYVKALSTSSAVGGTERYLHEAVARWAGWSLSAPRPARVIRQGGTRTRQKEDVVPQDSAARLSFPDDAKPDPEFPLRFASRVVPGSLPRLRFGQTYRLRARVVDLAGNSVRLGAAGDAHATPPVGYLRWEPLLPPDLVARNPFAAGASLQRMAIRSNIGTPAADFDTVNPAGQRGTDARFLAPPAAAVSLVEAHGELDPPRTPKQSYDLAAREGHKLSEPDPQPGSTPAFTHVGYDGRALSPASSADGAYWIHPGPTLAVVHLTDPVNSGVFVRGLPGRADDDPLPLPWGPWDAQQSWRIDLVEGAAGFSAANHVLTVSLPAAQTCRLRLSAMLGAGDAPLFGVLDAAGATVAGAAFDRATTGAERLLTPERELVLVHAAQRPLERAYFGKTIAFGRVHGEPYANIWGDVHVHVASTGQLDLQASWNAWVDAPGSAPQRVHTRAHVANIHVPAESGKWMPIDHERQLRHQFGDTHHRHVSYWLDATTRFGEYFDPHLWQVTPDLKAGEEHWILRRHVPSNARPAAPRVRYVVPTFTWNRHGMDRPGWTHGRSTRIGGGLRCWHERGWWSSGDGETLAAVLRANAPGDAQGQTFYSLYGRDPLTDTVAPDDTELRPKDFHAATGETLAVSRMVELDESPNATYYAVGAEPTYDAERDLYRFDLSLRGRANATYAPFVRLALARYQPWSIDGCEVSPVVLQPPVQLLPDRTLDARWVDDTSVDLTLVGQAPSGARRHVVSAWVERRRTGVGGDLGWETVADSQVVLNDGISKAVLAGLFSAGVTAKLALKDRVVDQVQFGNAGLPLAAPVDDGLRLTASRAELLTLRPELIDVLPTGIEMPLWILPGYRQWSGRVTLPAQRGNEPFRIVVVEQERLALDVDSRALTLDTPPVPEVAQRIVYFDALEA